VLLPEQSRPYQGRFGFKSIRTGSHLLLFDTDQCRIHRTSGNNVTVQTFRGSAFRCSQAAILRCSCSLRYPITRRYGFDGVFQCSCCFNPEPLNGYITAPIAHGTNSLPPMPFSSLLVFFPEATSKTTLKMPAPISSTVVSPSMVSPQLMSISSAMC